MFSGSHLHSFYLTINFLIKGQVWKLPTNPIHRNGIVLAAQKKNMRCSQTYHQGRKECFALLYWFRNQPLSSFIWRIMHLFSCHPYRFQNFKNDCSHSSRVTCLFYYRLHFLKDIGSLYISSFLTLNFYSIYSRFIPHL